MNSPDREAIEAEAIAWVVKLDGGALSDADRAAMREWAAKSPEHYKALAEMAEMWGQLDGLAALRADMDEEAETAPPAAAANDADGARSGRSRWAPAAMAAAIALAVGVAGVVWAALGPLGLAAQTETYTTGIGEIAAIALEDGSRLSLNTDTALEVTYERGERKVALTRGEAIFDVAPDARRPFTVYADGTAVRAVGTSFAVRLKQTHVGVFVTEGVVQLYPTIAALEAGGNSAPLARANEVGTLSRSEAEVHPIDPDQMRRLMAWRAGEFAYDGEPLSYVLEELARYTDLRFEFADPALRDIEIGGRFEIGETDALLQALEDGFGLEVARMPGSRVVISRAGAS